MPILLPDLPYDLSALSPDISAETLSYHYGKHHAGYVQTTNQLIKNSPLKDKNLTDLILISAADTVLTPLFNNAAQCFNHTFYWNSLSPNASKPNLELETALIRDFGSINTFKQDFITAATKRFGSGWAWLVYSSTDKTLKIITTANAKTPLTQPTLTPLLCIDVWEHAYYLDYQNRRADYLKAIVDNLLNWDFANQNFDKI